VNEMQREVIMDVRDVSVDFPIKNGTFGRVTGYIHAVEHVNFQVYRGETLGLVGESGCGKTTLLRSLNRMLKPSTGNVTFMGENGPVDVGLADKETLKDLHKHIRMVFQDPDTSLNPAMTVQSILAEPLIINRIYDNKEERDQKIEGLIERVGLKKGHLSRYVNTFSGGQKQRICVARALTLNPVLLLADEPTSALDVSVQAQIINLLLEIKKEYNLSMVFVSHDLSIIKHISDRIAVMYLGQFMELGTRDQVTKTPMHPYAEILFSSIPEADPAVKLKASKLIGDIPSVVNKPAGCPFHTRCPYCKDICKEQKPEFRDMGEGHMVACHFAGELDLKI